MQMAEPGVLVMIAAGGLLGAFRIAAWRRRRKMGRQSERGFPMLSKAKQRRGPVRFKIAGGDLRGGEIDEITVTRDGNVIRQGRRRPPRVVVRLTGWEGSSPKVRGAAIRNIVNDYASMGYRVFA